MRPGESGAAIRQKGLDGLIFQNFDYSYELLMQCLYSLNASQEIKRLNLILPGETLDIGNYDIVERNKKAQVRWGVVGETESKGRKRGDLVAALVTASRRGLGEAQLRTGAAVGEDPGEVPDVEYVDDIEELTKEQEEENKEKIIRYLESKLSKISGDQSSLGHNPRYWL